MYSHFESYLGFGLAHEDEIYFGTTIHVFCLTQPIPCLLMLWRLLEPMHQQAWYWSPKPEYSFSSILTHWGRVTHICVGKLTIIGSDNGLSPGRRQAIIWTNAGILLIGTLGTNFSEILFEIRIFSFKKMGLNVSAKWRPFCFGLRVKSQHLDPDSV